MGPSATMSATPSQPTFEQQLKELEGVVKQLASGDLSLEQSLRLFEQGIELSRTCRKQLQEAETRVEQLVKQDGEYQVRPFEHEELSR